MNTDRASSNRPPGGAERSARTVQAGRVGVFAIFDAEHDGDLYELLVSQSDSPGCEFSVIGGSKGSADTEAARKNLRRKIREADQVIVICGEHSEASPHIHTELLIVQDEQKPYFLLWGRRDVMCTKPIGATRAEGMYSWTQQFLHDQIAFNRRSRSTDREARSLRRKPGGTPTPPRPTPSATPAPSTAPAPSSTAPRDDASEDSTKGLGSR